MADAADIVWMRRAISAAAANLGQTWPNPVVGCLIVRDGLLISQGATAPGGRPHAEEQALAAAAAARGAVAYVTMEPCGFRSNGSASCGERLVGAGIGRVVVASANPDPLSAGQGLDRLAAAGVPVETGVLQSEADALYSGFFHRLRTGRPLLEAATSAEGFDAAFEPWLEESLDEALLRYGQAGYTRLWIASDSPIAEAAAAQGLLFARVGR